MKSLDHPAADRLARCVATLGKVLLLCTLIAVVSGCPDEADRGDKQRGLPRLPPQSAERGLVGKQLADFHVVALNEPSRSVAMGDLAGRVVLVDLWGTWCPPCCDELPHMAALGHKYRDRGDFRFLAISCGQPPESVDFLRRETQDYLRQTGLDLPTYLDPDLVTRRAIVVAGNLQGLGLPLTILMDRKGVIRDVWVGYDEDIRSRSRSWIARSRHC